MSRMDDLEMSRNIIMHTGVLPADEIDRIESIVRDLLRQIGLYPELLITDYSKLFYISNFVGTYSYT